jgi:putative DNA primase/helicase
MFGSDYDTEEMLLDGLVNEFNYHHILSGREAARLHQLGYSVIPIRTKTKKPLVPWKKFQSVRPELGQIYSWWMESPDAGVGIVLGQISRLVVIDIDSDDGQKTLKASGVYLEEFPTSVAASSRGHHFYFSYPKECQVKTIKFTGGEIRSDGSYIIAPPSVHPDGHQYEWKLSPFDSPPMLLPIKIQEFAIGHSPREIPMRDATLATTGGKTPEGERNNYLTSQAGSMKNRGMGKEAILQALLAENRTTCDPPLKESEVQGIVDSVDRYDQAEAPRRSRPSPVELAHELMDERPFVYTAETMYYYQNGVYKRGGDHKIKSSLMRRLGLSYRSSVAEEVIKYIQVRKYLHSADIKSQIDLINVQNGLLDWRTKELKEHTEHIVSFTQLPITYDPQATCPAIERYLESTLSEDCRELILQISGLCTIPCAKFQRAFMFTGESQTGKSTAINLITAFIGEDNVSHIPLQDLDGNRFKRADLYGKLVNVFADLDRSALKGTSYFKTIVAGDAIDAEKKFKDVYSFRPYARLIFSANELPHSPDNTNAFFRRWKIVPFDNKVTADTDDKNLISKLSTDEELSGLLNLAIASLKKLFDDGEFIQSESLAQAKEEYRRASDSAYAFLVENCEAGSDYSIGKSDLYEEYRGYCKDAGLQPLSRTRFNRRLKESFTVRDWLNDRRWHWKGIDLKQNYGHSEACDCDDCIPEPDLGFDFGFNQKQRST